MWSLLDRLCADLLLTKVWTRTGFLMWYKEIFLVIEIYWLFSSNTLLSLLYFSKCNYLKYRFLMLYCVFISFFIVCVYICIQFMSSKICSYNYIYLLTVMLSWRRRFEWHMEMFSYIWCYKLFKVHIVDPQCLEVVIYTFISSVCSVTWLVHKGQITILLETTWWKFFVLMLKTLLKSWWSDICFGLNSKHVFLHLENNIYRTSL